MKAQMGARRTGNRENMIGSLWMVAAMALFAVEDAFVKLASTSLPVGEVLVLFGFGGVILFGMVALLKNEKLFHADIVSLPMRIRVCFEVTGRLFYVLALALTPLSATTAILQATPIVVVLGAALLFGEKVDWRRWAAIIAGLIGVLIIIRPATNSFSPLAILALIGMIGFAGRDLASRAAPRTIATSALGFYGFAAIILAGVLYSLLWEQTAYAVPEMNTLGLLLAASSVGVLAYTALMKAMRTGLVSVVTPFRYTRLLFGIGLGVALFGEQVDVPIIIGSCIIVASGLFILSRR